MKLRILLIMSLFLLKPLVGLANPALTDTAVTLFASLNNDQKKQALLPFDNPERTSMVYPGGKRAGIQIKDLQPDQQKLAEQLIAQFTSDYGNQKVKAIAAQPSNTPDPTTGVGRYYLCFFGEPSEKSNWAWRIAEHHLTLVHVEVQDGTPKSFGPVLLGANPPDLWDAEEDKMIALHAAFTDAERSKSSNSGKAIASEPMKKKAKSIRVGDLSPSARKAAQDVLDHRLSFFADDIQKRIREQLDAAGGIDELRIAYFGDPGKKCREGGRWDFKLANDKFLCDYEGSRAHIHLSVKSN